MTRIASRVPALNQVRWAIVSSRIWAAIAVDRLTLTAPRSGSWLPWQRRQPSRLTSGSTTSERSLSPWPRKARTPASSASTSATRGGGGGGRVVQ
jgi:hypothetical protein